MSTGSSGPASHSAPGQYLGFALQPVRMFFHLLNSPEDADVSLEYLDDVAVHYSDGSILVEQAKSALGYNPLTDWSEDLWKTIANWLKELSSGVLSLEKTRFRLYVSPARTGKWSGALDSAATKDQVIALTHEIRKKLAARTTTPTCVQYLQKFLDATDIERQELVQRISIVSNVDDPIEEIGGLLAPAISSNLLESIIHAGIGMAKERADKLIRTGKPAIVSVSEFRRAFHSFVQRNNIPGYLTSVCAAPDASALQQVLIGQPNFVRQLEFIEATDKQKLRAVSDLLRTSADKTFWAESGLVFEGSFGAWEDTLIRRHGAVESEVNELHSSLSEAARGRVIYGRCSVLEIALEGREVPGHFAHGSFNALADDKLIGWHPRYDELFSKDEK